ncbi:MAG: imidazolonepropionase-like amidohydrolase [Pseudohongiellaceae bacterium]|jgi:imidazolonepropionase-like amidohydrolase
MLALILTLCSWGMIPGEPNQEADLAQARALFDRNIAAIQERDREAYLSCYLDSALLARGGPQGIDAGISGLAEGTPPSGSPRWPERLTARDLQLQWLDEGLVYGTYRYHVDYGGDLAAGLSERLFKRTDQGWRIVLTTAFNAAAGQAGAPLALVGARVHLGDGSAPINDAVIVTRDGLIESIGPRESTPIPTDVDVLDVTGQTITPGLIDAHVHYSQTGWADGRPDAWDVSDRYPYPAVMSELEQQPERFHRAFLASGITAVFDVGGYPWTRRLSKTSELSFEAPHIAAAGPLLATWVPDVLRLPDQATLVLMEDEEQVRRSVRSHAAAGSDAIKVWFVVRGGKTVEQLAPLVLAAGDEASKVGLPLVVHATDLATARVALEAGASLLVHSVDDALVDQEFVDRALQIDVSYCPTLTVVQGYIDLFGRHLSDELSGQLASGRVHPSIAKRVRTTPELPAADALSDAAIAAMEQRRLAAEAIMASNLTRLADAGVNIAAGTDAGNPLTLHGPSIYPELEAMQAAGMRPLDVLTAATFGAAKAMGRGHDLGLLQPGRIADLIILDDDPATDIAALRSITQVMRAGHLQKASSLNPR